MPMFYNIISYWLIGLLLGYHLTFARDMGPAGMWIGMIAGLTAGAVLMLTRFLRSSARMVRAGEAGQDVTPGGVNPDPGRSPGP